MRNSLANNVVLYITKIDIDVMNGNIIEKYFPTICKHFVIKHFQLISKYKTSHFPLWVYSNIKSSTLMSLKQSRNLNLLIMRHNFSASSIHAEKYCSAIFWKYLGEYFLGFSKNQNEFLITTGFTSPSLEIALDYMPNFSLNRIIHVCEALTSLILKAIIFSILLWENLIFSFWIHS